MAINSDLRDQAYEFFIEEAEELLQELESGLLELRQDRSTPKVHSLMRAAHSIKGGAASVGLDTIKDLAHRLEDIFKAFYNETVEINNELESNLLQAYDCLRDPLIAQIESGEFDATAAIAKAEPVFARIEAQLGNALDRADDYIPSSSDLGVDIVSSIFEIDVAQGIEHLETILANPQHYEIAGELRAQAEVFGGFGELLNLPGFSAIARASTTALDANGDRVLDILELMLADLRSARQIVLDGDRASGGSPSEALLALGSPSNNIAVDLDDLHHPTPSADDFDSIQFDVPDISLDEVFSGELTELTAQQDRADISLNEVFSGELTEELTAQQDSADISLDEVFSEDIETRINAELTAQQDSADISLDEVFSEDIETRINSELAKLESLDDSENVSVDEVFSEDIETRINAELAGLEAPQEIADLAGKEEVFSEDIETRINSELAGLEAPQEIRDLAGKEEVFSEDIETRINAELAKLESLDDSENVSVDEVFTENIAAELVNNNLVERSEIAAEIEAAENIEEIVQSIEQIFDRLPSIQENEPEKTAEEIKEKEIKITEKIEQKREVTPTKERKKFKKRINKKRSSSQRSSSGLSVRVDIERLEKMNNLVGELAIERNSLSLQNQQLQATVRELLNRFAQFRNKTDRLQEISDKMVISPNKSGSNPSKQFDRILAGETDFDSLEMDSYGATYSALQDIIEEIIQLEEAVDDIVLYSKQSDRSIDKQRQMLNYLRDELMWSRMLPLGEVFNRFPRLIRDMSIQYNKSVDLKISGAGVLVDKAVLEKLYDPLLHLLRNAFDHGIEYPEARQKQGKDEAGNIEISAYHQGNQTFIEIKDDGVGLNVDKITKRAIELGWLTSETAAQTNKSDILELIFKPGFSTATKVSELSGRGVGLDVVLSQLQSLKGKISVSSTPGEGTIFTLRLPLTLTISKLLICSSGSEAIALPSDSIEEIIIPRSSQIQESLGTTYLLWQMQEIPTYRLKDLLDYNYPLPNRSLGEIFNNTIPTPQTWASPLLLLRKGKELFALEIDRIVTEQELVIKPFGAAIAPPNYLYGCTIMGDGSLVPVINGSILLARCLEEDTDRELTISSSQQQDPIDKQKADRRWEVKTIMIVDDSSALRRTLALSLEKAAYRVIQAKDGKEAIDKLEQHPQVDLIVCDIEMPNMNGFEFLSYRRQKPEIADIPIAMLTSRSSKKHRQLATQLGASAYFSKPYVELDFLGAIEEIIKESRSATIPANK